LAGALVPLGGTKPTDVTTGAGTSATPPAAAAFDAAVVLGVAGALGALGVDAVGAAATVTAAVPLAGKPLASLTVTLCAPALLKVALKPCTPASAGVKV